MSVLIALIGIGAGDVRGGFGGVGIGLCVWDPTGIRSQFNNQPQPDGLPQYGYNIPSYGFGYLIAGNLLVGFNAFTFAYQGIDAPEYNSSQMSMVGVCGDLGILSTPYATDMRFYPFISFGYVTAGNIYIPDNLDSLVSGDFEPTTGATSPAVGAGFGFDFLNMVLNTDALGMGHNFVSVGIHVRGLWTPKLGGVRGLDKYQLHVHLALSFGGMGVGAPGEVEQTHHTGYMGGE